jgi:hypothetical protein
VFDVIPWTPENRTGGALDEVLDGLRKSFPDLVVMRLKELHPGDDDNVWFLTLPNAASDVQLDTNVGGRPPFLLESNSQRTSTDNATEALHVLVEWLRELPPG